MKICNYKDYKTSRVTDVITFSHLWQPRCLCVLSSLNMTWFITLFPSSWNNAVKSDKLTVRSVLMLYIVQDETWSSLSDLKKKKEVLLYCLSTKFDLIYMKKSMKLSTIICVIQGTSKTGLKSTLFLSIDSCLYFFQIKIPWPVSRGA